MNEPKRVTAELPDQVVSDHEAPMPPPRSVTGVAPDVCVYTSCPTMISFDWSAVPACEVISPRLEVHEYAPLEATVVIPWWASLTVQLLSTSAEPRATVARYEVRAMAPVDLPAEDAWPPEPHAAPIRTKSPTEPAAPIRLAHLI